MLPEGRQAPDAAMVNRCEHRNGPFSELMHSSKGIWIPSPLSASEVDTFVWFADSFRYCALT